MSESKIITYCHIGKVGGKRLQFYLRSHFGISYRCVARAKGLVYSRQELENDLKWNPLIKYLGGHSVRPHVDYGPIGERMHWFSFFRDPTARLLSHYYQQAISKKYEQESLMEWLLKNPNRGYWQIYMIAGENNLEKAKDIIQKQYSFIGLNEHYEKSLLLFADCFGLEDFQFVDGRSLPKPEKSDRFKTVLEEFEIHQDDIREIMQQEIQFYEFLSSRFQEQCENYGDEKLSQGLNSHFEQSPPLSRYNLNNLVANGLDRLLWRPKTRLFK